MTNPTIAPGILLSPVESGYVAYDPVLDRLHQLNPMAALLAELCDGSRSLEDIDALAGPLLPNEQGGEVRRWIEEGLKAGLLAWKDGEAGQRRDLSAEELAGLMRRLSEAGNVQPAYLCGKRAVELDPNDSNSWYELAEIAQCVGKRDEARSAYQRYFAAHPDDGEVEHLLLALRNESPPPRASDRAIQRIYRNFAASYEIRMCEDLKYAGPERLDEAIGADIGERAGLKILDLGCGSGLMGTRIRKRASELTGVDLSPEMAAIARGRNIYDRLDVAEITGWLKDGASLFD
ncbi:MAG: methyltransferase domain-containing protein, partial [Rhizomicrobium sp.]